MDTNNTARYAGRTSRSSANRCLTRLRRYFFTGVVILAPVAITVWATIWFIGFFDNLVKPLIPFSYNPDNYLPFKVPGTGLGVRAC